MKNKNIISLLLIALTFASCDLVGDIDSIEPQYQLEEKDVVTNAESAELLMRGVYKAWRAWDIGAFRAHGSTLIGSFNIGYVNGREGFADNTVQPNNITVTNLYTQLYTVVNTANMLLAQLDAGKAPDIDEVRRAEMLAECRLHRSMAWFTLLRYYGQFYDLDSKLGVVINEIPYRNEPKVYARATVKETYDKMMVDVAFAIENLPATTEPYYLSAPLAMAVKAKLLLFMQKYPEAEIAAQEAIDAALAADYSLESAYGNIFTNGYNSREVLFAPYTMGFKEFVQIPFKQMTYSNYTRTLSDMLPDGAVDGSIVDSRFSVTFPAGSTPLGKYPYEDNVPDTRGNTHFFMRLAEVYLIHAEAAARNSHFAAARASLQTILTRAEYDADAADNIANADLLEAIREHKWVELMGENNEPWSDVVRYFAEGNLNMGDVTAIKATLKKETQFILPIPESALAGNNLLVQNPQ